MTIRLSDETTSDLLASIRRYFREELDDDIGDLKARMMLDFILMEAGPAIYNKAIRDAQKYFQERTLDLDGSCYEEEMTYWKPKPGSAGGREKH